jgi:hypothetical protein
MDCGDGGMMKTVHVLVSMIKVQILYHHEEQNHSGHPITQLTYHIDLSYC